MILQSLNYQYIYVTVLQVRKQTPPKKLNLHLLFWARVQQPSCWIGAKSQVNICRDVLLCMYWDGWWSHHQVEMVLVTFSIDCTSQVNMLLLGPKPGGLIIEYWKLDSISVSVPLVLKRGKMELFWVSVNSST